MKWRRTNRGRGGGRRRAALPQPLCLLLLLLLLLLLPPSTSAAAVSTLDAEHFIAIAKRQMAALGVPEPSEECDSRYGSTYLARWAATGREVCAPATATALTASGGGDDDVLRGAARRNPPSSSSSSRVYCAAHPGAKLTTCVVRNLVLSDSDAFMGVVAPGTVPPDQPAGAPGSVRLACRMVLPAAPAAGAGGAAGGSAGKSGNGTSKAEALLRRRLDQDGPKQWLRAASLGGGGDGGGDEAGDGDEGAGLEVASACAGRGRGGAAVERPVLLITRTDGLNAFHTTESLLSVFSALAVAAPEMRRAGILLPTRDDDDAAGAAAGEEDQGGSGGGASSSPPARAWAQAEVVLADQAWPGPFLDIWRRIAAGAGGGGQRRRPGRGLRRRPPPPRDGREAAVAPLVRHLASRPFAAGTCLRRAMLLPYTPHGQSLLTYTGVGSDGRCGASPVAFGAALWLRHALRGAVPRRGFLLAAAEALERAGGDRGAGGEPFAHGYLSDGVAAPAWYTRHRAAEEEAAQGRGGGAGSVEATLRFFGRRFGGGGGNATAAADSSSPSSPSSSSSSVAIVPPFSPHMVRLKLVWISRAHYERHGGSGDADAAADADASADADLGTSSSSSWQRQRRLSPAAEREVVLALQEAVLTWNARACALPAGEGAAEAEEEEREGRTEEGRRAAAASSGNDDGSRDGSAAPPPRRRLSSSSDGSSSSSSSSSKASTTAPSCRPSPVLFELEALELSDLAFFPDQAHALTRAGVLAGVHGAGLSNMLLMRPGCGSVVEVWHNMRDNYHYQNLAALLAHGYARVEGEGARVDAGAVALRAAEAMDRAAAQHVAAARALLGERRQRRHERRRRGRGAGGGAFPWGFRG